MRTVAAAAFVILATAMIVASPSRARAWELFRRPNPNVEAGNAHLRAGRGEAALTEYDRAARQLPDEPGVSLDRGLALLAEGRLDEALEAFLRAAEPPAPAEMRADSYYDRGVALMRQGEAHAEEEAHEQAQDRFRLAAESFRRSLAARPSDRDTAWNLEIALRRLHEEEEEQRQQQQDQQDQQQDPQDQQQDPQDQQQDQQDQQQDQQDQQQGPQDQQQGQQDQQQDPQDQQNQAPAAPSDADGEREQPGSPQTLPSEAARVLDSLEASEENLERMRARARAMRERRLPTKDW